MMKNIILSLLLPLSFGTYSFIAFPLKGQSVQRFIIKDSLSIYTGKYVQQGTQTIYADVYVENGKLLAKSSTGDLLILERISGDNFKITGRNVPIKFIRDSNNNVFQISINGSIAWARVQDQLLPTMQMKFNPNDFLGRYQLTVDGQTLKIEVSFKIGKLWATQLWDGRSSTLDFVSADKFIVNALSLPLGFTRNKNNEVVQLLFNNHDIFIKVKN